MNPRTKSIVIIPSFRWYVTCGLNFEGYHLRHIHMWPGRFHGVLKLVEDFLHSLSVDVKKVAIDWFTHRPFPLFDSDAERSVRRRRQAASEMRAPGCAKIILQLVEAAAAFDEDVQSNRNLLFFRFLSNFDHTLEVSLVLSLVSSFATSSCGRARRLPRRGL